MTPKEQFLETPHAEPHRKLVQTVAFREALNYAMLEVQREASAVEGRDQFETTMLSVKLLGAAQLRRVLENLGTLPVPQGTKQPPGLDHTAYDGRRNP